MGRLTLRQIVTRGVAHLQTMTQCMLAPRIFAYASSPCGHQLGSTVERGVVHPLATPKDKGTMLASSLHLCHGQAHPVGQDREKQSGTPAC
jgi:hypothetical protein